MSISEQLGDLSEYADFVVFGLTTENTPFQMTQHHAQRGDWADHLCNMLATVGQDMRIRYSEHVRPAVIANTRSVIIKTQLREVDPLAFELIEQFVREHRLKVRHGRTQQSATEALSTERRDPERNAW